MYIRSSELMRPRTSHSNTFHAFYIQFSNLYLSDDVLVVFVPIEFNYFLFKILFYYVRMTCFVLLVLQQNPRHHTTSLAIIIDSSTGCTTVSGFTQAFEQLVHRSGYFQRGGHQDTKCL